MQDKLPQVKRAPIPQVEGTSEATRHVEGFPREGIVVSSFVVSGRNSAGHHLPEWVNQPTEPVPTVKGPRLKGEGPGIWLVKSELVWLALLAGIIGGIAGFWTAFAFYAWV